MNKKIIIGGVAIAVASSAITSMAGGTLQQISANLNHAISIVYNGETQVLKDANGVTLAPISYLGSTYVPVRAVSDIFGEDVHWDGATNTITLGSMEKQPVDLTTKITVGTDESWKIVDATELVIAGSDANQTYKSGIAYMGDDAVGAFGNHKGIELDVAGYSSLTFTVYCEEDMTIIVGDENYDTIHKFELPGGTLKEVEIDISGQDKIIFGGEPIKSFGPEGIIKFLEPTVK